MNSSVSDINSLLSKITDNHSVDLNYPNSDQVSHLRKEENNDRLYKILPLERDKNINKKPLATLSSLNRNFDLEDNKRGGKINDRMQYFEPLSKNSYKVYEPKPEINTYTKRNSYKDQDIFSNKTNDTEKSDNFNRMIFNSKRDDSNEKFQTYSPLPKNLGLPVNKNKLIFEEMRPTDTRTNYKFKPI